jgi:two-component system LytT family sensor kinase
MTNKQGSLSIPFREIIFQLVLHLVVFVFFTYDRENPQLKVYDVWYFLSYAIAAFTINYLLLPKFFYKKKYLPFIIYVALIIAAVILTEELVIEQIYFPDTRAKRFPGVFYTMMGILPVITILSGFKFAWDALGKQREVEDLKLAVQESELQFLKSQINPHFLFNNLNNLYAYAIENSPKTPEIILELSGVLRYMLYECREKYVPLTKEITQLDNFIKLNELQIEERGKVHFKSNNIREGVHIAPLILTVFIENAFKHSTASQSKDIMIEVEVSLDDKDVLTFNCKNSYKPQTNTDNLSNGIGLQNVQKRLELIYPDAHKLDIIKQETIYEVNLVIELNAGV